MPDLGIALKSLRRHLAIGQENNYDHVFAPSTAILQKANAQSGGRHALAGGWPISQKISYLSAKTGSGEGQDGAALFPAVNALASAPQFSRALPAPFRVHPTFHFPTYACHQLVSSS